MRPRAASSRATAGARGAGGVRPAGGGTLRAWAELLRLPALCTVPGDVLAGAVVSGAHRAGGLAGSGRRVLLAAGSSICLYEAGMALNDWADREVDAVERPHRPLPSGRVSAAAALAASGALTAAGLTLAAAAGTRARTVATGIAATVWAYDLGLKHTPAGPAAMAAARALDLLLGAAATGGRLSAAVPSAAVLGTHTFAVTTVSRHEAQGGSTTVPLAALAVTACVARVVTTGQGAAGSRVGAAAGRFGFALPAGRRAAAAPGLPGLKGRAPAGHRPAVGAPPSERDDGVPSERGGAAAAPGGGTGAGDVPRVLLGAAYARTAGRPLLHAALNPSPELTQRAVGAGVRATIPLQAALAARGGSTAGLLTGALIAALAPVARTFARKVSVT